MVWEQFDRIVQNANDIDIVNIPRAPKRESHRGLTASYRMAQVIGGQPVTIALAIGLLY